MHYYQFNIGNYRRKTEHLTHLEHGIYRRLIDAYYLDDGPLCGDKAKLMRSHMIRTPDEERALENILEEFFTLENGFYRHSDCDDRIAKYQEKSEKARQSAKKRWASDANALPAHSEGSANHKPITNNQEPEKKKRIAPKRTEPTRPAEIPENLWADFLAVRKAKKAPLTETALNGILGEAEKAGITLGQALTCCCERNWQGFKASWYQNANTGGQQPGGLGRHPITTAQGASYETTPDEDLPDALRG
jgi:uncharacterized protein YdaU (DUF1376 family)